MGELPVTTLAAAVLAPLFLVLSARVILVRRSGGVALGDGGDPVLARRIRAQANFAEYAPLGLVLLALLELRGVAPGPTALAGALLVLGRLGHGIALTRATPWMLGRVGGTALTLTALGVASAALLHDLARALLGP